MKCTNEDSYAVKRSFNRSIGPLSLAHRIPSLRAYRHGGLIESLKPVMQDRGRVPSRISPTSRILRRSSVSVTSVLRSPTHGHAAPA